MCQMMTRRRSAVENTENQWERWRKVERHGKGVSELGSGRMRVQWQKGLTNPNRLPGPNPAANVHVNVHQ